MHDTNRAHVLHPCPGDHCHRHALYIHGSNNLAKIGVVIMHGKGGSLARHVSDLASSLEKNGYLVANLEMPWSGRRDYDVSVSAAEKGVQSALAALRDKGAPSASQEEIVRWITEVVAASKR